MKKTNAGLILAMGLAIAFTSCDRTAGARYIDLSTGKEVELVKDENTGLYVDAGTRRPLYMYVDTKTNDTIYGSTGKVVNGHVTRLEDGTYRYNGAYEYKSPGGDYKVEVEKDGDVKIKDGDRKVKIDGESGEKKVKYDD